MSEVQREEVFIVDMGMARSWTPVLQPHGNATASPR